MTYIYYTYISEQNHSRLLSSNLGDFPKDFGEKVLKYRRWQDGQLSLLGRLLLRNGLKKIGSPIDVKNIEYDSYNKPYLKNENMQFNISHSGNIVVCVICDATEIGVDIEIIKDINVSDYKIQMTEREWHSIHDSKDTKMAFFNYWTQKEAAMKAEGNGLSIPLKSFEIIDNTTIINGEKFFLKKIRLDKSYKCHLAFKNGLDDTIYSPQKIEFN